MEQSSFYELIDVPLKAATQTIGAYAATASEAKLLGIKAGSPVLRCERITFVVDLPSVAQSIAPRGLRLME